MSGWKPVLGTPDVEDASADQIRRDIRELSTVAQRAEAVGNRVLAEAAHHLINDGIDRLR